MAQAVNNEDINQLVQQEHNKMNQYNTESYINFNDAEFHGPGVVPPEIFADANLEALQKKFEPDTEVAEEVVEEPRI